MASRKQASKRVSSTRKKTPAKKTPAKASERTAEVTPPSDNSALESARAKVCEAAVAASPALDVALHRLQSTAGSKDLALIDPALQLRLRGTLENLVVALEIYRAERDVAEHG